MTAKQRAARAKFKAVVAEAKKLRKKNPKLTQAQAVKQAFAISYSKAGKKKVGAAPKKKAATKVKAKKSRSTEMHTDTKSHNVNIRVMSGLSKITGTPHKSKYFIKYKIDNIQRMEYFDKLPKDRYVSPSERIVYLMRNTDNGTALVPLRFTKNDLFVKK
jgi:hypothetical protein